MATLMVAGAAASMLGLLVLAKEPVGARSMGR
jgi:hypothetical protein